MGCEPANAAELVQWKATICLLMGRASRGIDFAIQLRFRRSSDVLRNRRANSRDRLESSLVANWGDSANSEFLSRS
jgi:hypothetical protein